MSTLLNTASLLSSLTLRPARASDEAFLARLYRTARPDLLLIDAEEALIRTVQAQQYQVLLQGAGNGYGPALHFVVEQTGRVTGAEAIKGLQRSAWQVRTPLTTAVPIGMRPVRFGNWKFCSAVRHRGCPVVNARLGTTQPDRSAPVTMPDPAAQS